MIRPTTFVRDRSGVALIEFAYAMPVLLVLGFMGSSVADLATTNMKLSQTTLTAADNGSRLGEADTLSVRQLRERDVNDVFDAAGRQARGLELFKNGRVIISSVQQLSSDPKKQVVFWQRCRGLKPGETSVLGAQGTRGKNNKPLDGMATLGQPLTAPADSAIIVVESFYDYQPITDVKWAALGDRELGSSAVFMVRDKRDLSAIYNPSPNAPVYSCDKLTD